MIMSASPHQIFASDPILLRRPCICTILTKIFHVFQLLLQRVIIAVAKVAVKSQATAFDARAFRASTEFIEEALDLFWEEEAIALLHGLGIWSPLTSGNDPFIITLLILFALISGRALDCGYVPRTSMSPLTRLNFFHLSSLHIIQFKFCANQQIAFIFLLNIIIYN